MGKVTQHQKIINHLNTHRGITSKVAYERYGITQLATRISEIEKKGYLIDRTRIEGVNRDGEPCRFVEYSLMEEGDFNGKAE